MMEARKTLPSLGSLNGGEKSGLIIKCGFSGTREGMSQNQKDFVFHFLKDKKGEFHHGDCIGADAEAHDLAEVIGYRIVIHPPADESKRAYKKGWIEKPKLPYKVRNKNIVSSTAFLLACPKGLNQVGGTWNAIRWAKMLKRQFYIILPNGDIYHDA